MRFYLGTHLPNWLGELDVPLFVSRRRITRQRRLPRARAPWALDSGGFSELNAAGCWSITPRQYADEVRHYAHEIGRLEWAAIMDWMCEPFVLQKTGLTVTEHQQRTVASYLDLRNLAPDLPWVPVLQGWSDDDYLRHMDDYAAAGIDLGTVPTVGIGSVCRRQHTDSATGIIRRVTARGPAGMQLHGFGLKLQGLRAVGTLLASADSMAWSFDARRLQRPTCGSTAHKNCANCREYALAWRERVLAALDNPRPIQYSLFDLAA